MRYLLIDGRNRLTVSKRSLVIFNKSFLKGSEAKVRWYLKFERFQRFFMGMSKDNSLFMDEVW